MRRLDRNDFPPVFFRLLPVSGCRRSPGRFYQFNNGLGHA
jgi:hypothetical protein